MPQMKMWHLLEMHVLCYIHLYIFCPNFIKSKSFRRHILSLNLRDFSQKNIEKRGQCYFDPKQAKIKICLSKTWSIKHYSTWNLKAVVNCWKKDLKRKGIGYNHPFWRPKKPRKSQILKFHWKYLEQSKEIE